MIRVDETPNALKTYRYDVEVRGRITHGFRWSLPEARKAAQEDANLLFFCAHSEQQREDHDDD